MAFKAQICPDVLAHLILEILQPFQRDDINSTCFKQDALLHHQKDRKDGRKNNKKEPLKTPLSTKQGFWSLGKKLYCTQKPGDDDWSKGNGKDLEKNIDLVNKIADTKVFENNHKRFVIVAYWDNFQQFCKKWTYPFDVWLFLKYQFCEATLGERYHHSKKDILYQICCMPNCSFHHYGNSHGF